MRNIEADQRVPGPGLDNRKAMHVRDKAERTKSVVTVLKGFIHVFIYKMLQIQFELYFRKGVLIFSSRAIIKRLI